jgi:hypothetical protein
VNGRLNGMLAVSRCFGDLAAKAEDQRDSSSPKASPRVMATGYVAARGLPLPTIAVEGEGGVSRGLHITAYQQLMPTCSCSVET